MCVFGVEGVVHSQQWQTSSASHSLTYSLTHSLAQLVIAVVIAVVTFVLGPVVEAGAVVARVRT